MFFHWQRGDDARPNRKRPHSDRSDRTCTDIWTPFRFTARADLFIRRIANTENFELKQDFPAAKRMVSIDGQRLLIDSGDEKALGLAILVLH